MVVASRLGDGRVVFLTPGGHWSDSIADGAVAAAGAEAERLLSLGREAEANNEVVEPYLIEVTEAGGMLRPFAWREVIRVAGPTVRTDLPADPPRAVFARDAGRGR